MKTKTYAECERDIEAELRHQPNVKLDGREPFKIHRDLAFLKAKCVQLTYEIECMKDKSGTEEMHGLYERMGGK